MSCSYGIAQDRGFLFTLCWVFTAGLREAELRESPFGTDRPWRAAAGLPVPCRPPPTPFQAPRALVPSPLLGGAGPFKAPPS